MPTNYKSEVLPSQLPYLANLEDPVFQSNIQNVINNREDFQKYLLAAGDLSKSIQESLDLVVSNGGLSKVSCTKSNNREFVGSNLNF